MTFNPLFGVGAMLLFGICWFSLVLVGYGRGRGRMSAWTLLRRFLMGVLALLIFAGPSVPGEEESLTSNVEIFLAVDRTGSMAAEDWGDGLPRLEGVRRDLQQLVASTPGARYSIVTWDSTARIELPLTTDSSAVTSFAQSLHQEISEFSSGSSVSRPAALLLDTLGDSALSRPENVRYLVVISDGENTDEAVAGLSAQWAEIDGLIDGGGVIGYGTEAGGPMRIFVPGAGPQEEYMEDPADGEVPALSHLDEAELAQLAEVLGVPLLLNPEPEQVEQLGDDFMSGAALFAEGRDSQVTYRYVIWPIALLLSALLLWELAEAGRQVARLWRTDAL